LKKAVLYIILLAPVCVLAQIKSDKHEWGVQGGVMNYLGDLSPGMKMSQFHPEFGAFYRFNHSSYFASRLGVNYGNISGADSIWDFNRTRNLQFFSQILEVSGMSEFHFQKFGFDKFSHRFSPFFCLGFNVFYFEPKTNYRATAYALRPFATEGQLLRHNSNYQRINWALPLGGGFKVFLNKNFVLGLECFWRKTGTDYLDDVSSFYPKQSDLVKFNDQRTLDERLMTVSLYDRSGERNDMNGNKNLSFEGKQRGNPNNKDWFYTIGVSLSYRVVKYSCKKGGF